MKKKLLIFALILTTTPFISISAKKKVLYGPDNRKFISDLPSDYLKTKNLAKGVAAFILNDDFKIDRAIALVESFSQEELGLCHDEKYSQLPEMSYCTGILVGNKYMLTAGHCVDQYLCPEMSVAFNYHHKSLKKDGLVTLKSKNVYGCKQVIKRIVDNDKGIDFAIIELKRNVKHQTILKIASSKPSVGDKISMIGFPSGLPQMYTDQATIFELNENTFKSNLDAFGGNSGSPIFNKNGKVTGILVGGSTDTYFDQENKCERIKTCNVTNTEECRGESGVYVYSFINELIKNLN